MILDDLIKVDVTQWDIDHGYKKDCHNCPIALALTGMFPNALVAVDDSEVSIGVLNIYNLPTEAKEFIRRFDRSLEVKPFSFVIENVNVSKF